MGNSEHKENSENFVNDSRNRRRTVLAVLAGAGAPLPLPVQHAAEAVWRDEAHVTASRALYHEKYALADEIFAGFPGYQPPMGGFFLWLPVAPRFENGEEAAIAAWEAAGVRVLPGAYLGRVANGLNPGDGYIRAAMVAPKDDVARGLIALRALLDGQRRSE